MLLVKNIKKITSIIIILIVSLFVLYGSFSKPGMYRTHDGGFHVIRSMHFINELKHGQFPVRMVPNAAYSFGYLIFQFFYPLPAYITSVFQLTGLSTTLSWKLMQATTTILSLIFFYLFMRCTVNRRSSLVATVLFAIVPFRFLSLYVTGQLGGYTALMFAPLIGLGLHKLLDSKNKKSCRTTSRQTRVGGIILSIGIMGMITSHLLSVIIFFLPLSGYAVWLLQKDFSYKKLFSLMAWTLLGAGLSAFYFLPFMFEKSWIKLGHKILIDYREHWPTFKQLIYSKWGFGYSNKGPVDGMSFQIGFSMIISFIFSLMILFLQKKKSKIGIIFTTIFATLFFLMLSISAPVWKIIKPLELIQYPWRLLAAITFTGSWLAGWSLNKLTKKQFAITTIFLLLISFYNIRNYTKPWPLSWKQDSDFLKNSAVYYGSTDISWELMPVNANRDSSRKPGLVNNSSNSGVTVNKIFYPKKGNTRIIINIESTKDTFTNISIWDLPVWRIENNGKVVIKQTAKDGTISFPIKKGNNTIKVILQKTKLQLISDYLTLISFIILIFVMITPKYIVKKIKLLYQVRKLNHYSKSECIK